MAAYHYLDYSIVQSFLNLVYCKIYCYLFSESFSLKIFSDGLMPAGTSTLYSNYDFQQVKKRQTSLSW